MRLTTNNLKDFDPKCDFCIDCKYFGKYCGFDKPNGTCVNYKRFNAIYSRLAELEDIEEVLRCDLINLFKALKQGYIYVKLEDGIIKREVDMLDFKEGVRCVLFDKSCQVDNNMQCYQMLNYIQDYGKSWALTREELEDKNDEKDEETLRRYSELIDRNGKKIFEGDLVKSNTDTIFVVKFGFYDIASVEEEYRTCYGFYLYNIKDNRAVSIEEGDVLEVIGNIYDNPELIK